MQALANCKTALIGMMNGNANQQMKELQSIANNAHAHLNQQLATSKQQVPRVESKQVPRVDTNTPHQAPTHAPAPHTPSRPAGTPTAQQRSHCNSLSHLMAKINLPAAPPALSTHSKVRVANNRQCIPRLRQPTQSSLGKTRQANAVVATSNWRCLLHKVEQDVKQALAVMDQDSGKMMNYCQLMKHPKFSKAWTKSSANEFGQLASGVGSRVKGTETIRFIHQHEMPQKRRKDVTYGSFLFTARPQKDKPNQTCFTVGGDRISYPGKVAMPTADMFVAKILLNSVISTHGARFMTINISNFYLMTKLK